MIFSKVRAFSVFLAAILFSTLSLAGIVSYQTPTTDSALAAVSTFRIDLQCTQSSFGALTIKYSYPQELTGVPVEISMQQSRFDSNYYFGALGEMKCTSSNCSVHYNQLPFDENALNLRLKQISLTDVEYNSRMQVAMINHADPGGTFNESPNEYCKNSAK